MSRYGTVSTFSELERLAPCSLGGWMCQPERDFLFNAAKLMQPHQRFLEIGVYGGTTLALFALLAPHSCEIIGMDSWENDTPNNDPDTGQPVDLRTFCIRNLEKGGVADRVRLIDGSSHMHGPHWNMSLDVLIIDGDHTYDGAKQDLIDFARWVVPGGLLIMDDYWSDTAVSSATEDWLRGEMIDAWRLEWGFLCEHNETNGLVSKMRAYRRLA